VNKIKAKQIESVSGSQTRLFNFFGVLVPTTGNAKFYPPQDIAITSLYAAVGVQSASPISATLKKNGVSVGAVTISANASKSTPQAVSIPVLSTDYLTADLTTSGGENLSLTLVYT